VSGGDWLRQPLTTKEGWAAFVSRGRPQPPQLLPASDLERLTETEREIYDEALADYHSEVLLVATPDIRQITATGSKLMIGNRGKQLGRRGLIVSGPSGTGKSTSITQLGRKHQVETERRHPGLSGQIPVVYIIVPPAATPKTLAIEFATFLGLPVSSRDSQHLLARAVTDVLRKVGCSLVLVDEVHRLDLRTRAGAQASDQLKYFFDSVSATFVYAGLDLEENGMFSGMRGRQIAGRFISLGTSAFKHATAAQRGDWARLSPPWSRPCCCTATSPGPSSRWRPTCTSGPAA
jgi:AAA domain